MGDSIRKGWARDFFQAPNEIYDRRDINGYAKAVFVYLCRRADDDSRAFPAYERIAEEVGFSKSTVRRAIDNLVEAGLLVKEPRYDGRGFQVSNLYTLIRPSTVPEKAGSGFPPGAGGEAFSNSSGAAGDGRDAPPEQAGCSGRAPGMLCEDTRGALREHPGCSVGTPRVLCGSTEEYPDDQDPVDGESIHPDSITEEDPSVSQSVCHDLEMPGRKRLTDRRIEASTDTVIKKQDGNPSVSPSVSPPRNRQRTDGRNDRKVDFGDVEAVIRYYAGSEGATERQVRLAMLSVQAQLDRGAVIQDVKAYFEKCLRQLVQEERFRGHFL